MEKFPALQDVYPPHDLRRGKALWAFLLSTLSAFIYTLLLFLLYLIVDLLVSQGSFNVSAEDSNLLTRLSGRAAPAISVSQEIEASGILNSLWWLRKSFAIKPLSLLYQHVPWLQKNNSALLLLVITTVCLAYLRSVILSRTRRLCSWSALETVTRLRKTIHRQILRLGPGDLLNVSGEQVNKLFRIDSETLQNGIIQILSIITRYPVRLILLFCMAMCFHWMMTLQCIIPLVACWFLVYRAQQRFLKQQLLSNDRSEAELRLLSESLQKTNIVRGYGMEDFEHERFQKRLERFQDSQVNTYREERTTRWTIRVLITFCLAMVLYLLGIKVLINPQDLSFSAAIFLSAIFASMYIPAEALCSLREVLPETESAAQHILQFRNKTPDVSQAVGAKFMEPLTSALLFESVTYSLPNEKKLLDNLELKLPAGKRYAILSLDPLEARSLVYLLPRFIEAQAGRVLIDGEDIAWATLDSLRAETVYVGGDDLFFTGTVMENISCGNSQYSLQNVTDAAKTAHAHKFILNLPHGYETMLGNHGEELGTGEGYRLGLARALLRDPALMLIEEPTSTIGTDTKSLLDDTYDRIFANRTILFLPKRLSTLRKVDQIILLHQGKINAMGTYAELVKKSELYRHWEYQNFNEFRQAD